jgi:hypothetical protein
MTGDIRVPYLSLEVIRSEADRCRDAYWKSGELPVDVLEIAEFDLDLTIVPKLGLREAGDVEALLLRDMSTLLVDHGAFIDDRIQSRLRFSVAHEIGHLVLHTNLVEGMNYSTVEEWVEAVSSVPRREYFSIEFQANEFAG